MKQVYTLKEKCYGCRACENVCPVSAITCVADGEGFIYPVIDTNKCVDCGRCKIACPIDKKIDKEDSFVQRYYAARHKNDAVLMASSSGGVFSALAEAVLRENGCVYGARMDEQQCVMHFRIDTMENLKQLTKTKYIQSDLKSVYSSLIADLRRQRFVLFVGTPCQVAGVKAFLRDKDVNREKILLCDFICHGVSSPLVWEQYVEFLSKKYGSTVKEYQFRNKLRGWRDRTPIIVLKDGTDISEKQKSKESYMKMYASCYLSRPSCYQCGFTSFDRNADITLADFWNIGAVNKSWDDNKGVSEVLVNTTIGAVWFEKCREMLSVIECGKTDVWQPHLEYPNEMPKGRKQFWDEYELQGIEYVVDKYGKGSFAGEAKRILTPLIRKLGLYTFAGKVYKVVFEKRN